MGEDRRCRPGEPPHRFGPQVSLHIPWDTVESYGKLAEYAVGLGMTIGAINSNVIQDDDHLPWSLCNSDRRMRIKAIHHHRGCIEIRTQTGSTDLKIWLRDGTNYPGQDDLRSRQERLAECLAEIYAALQRGQRMILEYKFFEPAFYATDISDWGTSLFHCMALGDRATVVLDTGHHAPGTNLKFVVMQLLRVGRLGAFDFNSRFYADDDRMVGAADPFQMFRIVHEIVLADALRPDSGVSFTLDQCHKIEPKIPGQIRSIMNEQEATAKALLVDHEALATAQQADSVPSANGILMDAFARSGYLEQIAAERVGGNQSGLGRVNR